MNLLGYRTLRHAKAGLSFWFVLLLFMLRINTSSTLARVPRLARFLQPRVSHVPPPLPCPALPCPSAVIRIECV